jgi:type II secretory pathway component PulF
MALPLMVLLLAAFVAPLPAFVSGGSVMGYMAAVLLPLIVALAVWQAGARMFASRVEGGVWHEVLDLLLLQTPVVRGVERERNLGDFASLLGLQLAAGVPINRALETCARCLPNGHYRAAVTEALNQVQNGRPLSKTLGSELFPQEFVATVAVGEQAGALDASLKRYAAQARENYARAVQGLTAWLQRGLYVVVALFVLFNIARLALTVFAGYGSVVR